MVSSPGAFGAWGFQSSLDSNLETCNLHEDSFVNQFSSISEEPEDHDPGEIPEACRQYEGLSVEEIHVELHQVQESRAATRQRLLQAAQRGQELVAEENRLQTQLSDHLAALDDEGSPNGRFRKKSADSELEFEPAMSFGGFGAAPSMAFSRTVRQNAATKKAHKQMLKDQIEVDRLRGLNVSMQEQLEERELAFRRNKSKGDIGNNDGDMCDFIDEETRHRLNSVRLDIQDATNNARHAEASREREIAEVERELMEIRRQSASMMVVVAKRLEATRQRNMRLKDALEAQSAAVIDQSPLHESIQNLRNELEVYQKQGDEMDAELQEVRNEVAVAEDNHFEAQTQVIESKIEVAEAKHHRLAMAQVMPLSHHTSTTASEDSESSEVWHYGENFASENLDEPRLNMVSKATSRSKVKTRLRQRQLHRHLHKDMEVVVNTTKLDDAAPNLVEAKTEEKAAKKTSDEKHEKNDNGWDTWTSYFGTAADFYNRNVAESW